MRLKTQLVVFLLVLSVGFSVSLEDFLDVSLLDEVQDNRPAPIFRLEPLVVMFDELLEKNENRTRLASPQPGEPMNGTNNDSGINHGQEREEIPPEPTDSIVISWMEKPPYVMFDEEPLEKNEHRTRLASSQPGEAMNATNNNSGINQESVQGSSPGFRVKGIFQEVVSKGLLICTEVPFTEVAKKADNLRELDKTIVNKEAHLVLPVQGSEDGSYGGHTYVEVLKSPGVVFIVDKQQTLKHLRKRVLQAMKDTWPVIILTLLLAGFAGILIWGLVSVYIFNNLRKVLLT